MTTTTKHTCTDTGKALPFGRKAPEGECPRCDELRNGAEPVRFAGSDRREADRQEARRAAANRAKGLCSCGRLHSASDMCTYGEW
jgi:hypothetical protein